MPEPLELWLVDDPFITQQNLDELTVIHDNNFFLHEDLDKKKVKIATRNRDNNTISRVLPSTGTLEAEAPVAFFVDYRGVVDQGHIDEHLVLEQDLG